MSSKITQTDSSDPVAQPVPGDHLNMEQLREGMKEIMAQRNTGAGEPRTDVTSSTLANDSASIADSVTPSETDSTNPSWRDEAVKKGKSRNRSPKKTLLNRHNQEVVNTLPRLQGKNKTEFYKDAVRQDAAKFLRTMTLLFRFGDVFQGRSYQQITSRLIEEGDVNKLGGLAQVLEMGVQAGFLQISGNGEQAVLKATQAGRTLISSVPTGQNSPPYLGNELLEQQLVESYQKLCPTSKSDLERQRVVKDVQRHLDREFRSIGFLVELFGSSGSGLYFPGSDIDLCAYYSTMPPVRTIAIQQLGASLRRATWCSNVFTVAHAKIPVIKLVHAVSGLKVDISIENTIAIENTRLMALYMNLDDRVKPLAFALKVWCKSRAISHPEEGTLSSYSWTLMLIHYLQRTQPPILPNLQENTANLEPFSHTYNGSVIDCYYDETPSFKSDSKLKVSDLLAGFFHYYAKVFDFDTQVVNIAPIFSDSSSSSRELEILTKKQKGRADWERKSIAIQDPFIDDRNTAVGCSPILAEWIFDEIHRASTIASEGGSFADIVNFIK